MKNSLIVEISEGLGNQLFMYANAFALADKKQINLLIDDTSGFYKKKNTLRGQRFLLNRFNINQKIAPNNLKSDTFFKYIIKKLDFRFGIFKNINFYLNEKNILQNQYKKISGLIDYDKIDFFNNVFLKGNFEDEDYFKDYYKELRKLFLVKSEYINNNTLLINNLKNTTSISIHIRQNRYSDQNIKKNNFSNFQNSKKFLYNNLQYIERAIKFFNNKFEKPTFFVWSNDFNNLDNFFSKFKENKFHLIKNNDEINDFNLFRFSKHFIVGPSTFHWWGAWLNNSPDKICVRPININPSNNDNFWPKKWLKI